MVVFYASTGGLASPGTQLRAKRLFDRVMARTLAVRRHGEGVSNRSLNASISCP
jgi:hypothetical protein